MEIRIECPCGQPFKFDVEPANGLLPHGLRCPACGTDATDQANAVISNHLVSQPEPAVAVALPPPPAAPVSTPSQYAKRAPGTGYSPAANKPRQRAGVGSDDRPFVYGVLGALAGAALGMLGWFLLIKFSGYEIGYAAWGVGALTGAGARVTGVRGRASLGLTAGLLAFVAIIGGQYLAVRDAVVAHGLSGFTEWDVLKAGFSAFTLLWLVLGLGSAYKLGAGTND
jgi:hypothetical protein